RLCKIFGGSKSKRPPRHPYTAGGNLPREPRRTGVWTTSVRGERRSRMAEQELTRAAVRHASLKGKAPVACLDVVKGIVVGAVESAEVKASPIAGPALAALLVTLADTDDAYQKKLTLQQALRAANKAVALQTAKLRSGLFMYETAVDDLAGGNANV